MDINQPQGNASTAPEDLADRLLQMQYAIQQLHEQYAELLPLLPLKVGNGAPLTCLHQSHMSLDKIRKGLLRSRKPR